MAIAHDSTNIPVASFPFVMRHLLGFSGRFLNFQTRPQSLLWLCIVALEVVSSQV